jgi:trimethylamine---corrinoid protein Co-methyltransferase
VSSKILNEPYNPLSKKDVEIIYSNALKVLSEIGIRVPGDDAKKIYRKLGCHYSNEKQTIFIGSKIVEKALNDSRKSFILGGRNPVHDICIGKGQVYFTSGGAAPGYLVKNEKTPIRIKLTDLIKLTHLIDYLPYIDICHRMVEPSDISSDILDINKYYACVKNTTKHIVTSVLDVNGLKKIIRLAEIIAGSKKSLIEKPLVTIVCCWMLSPLLLHPKTTTIAIEAIKKGIPVEFSSCPMSGSTAPVTLSGTLTQFLAEILSAKVLAYGVNPDTPVIIGGVPAISDPNNLSFSSGAPEFGLLNAAAAQFGRFFKYPNLVSAAYSDDKIIGVQAGYETALSALLVAMAGGEIIHGYGLFDSALTVSAESIVIANEVAGMVKRIIKGITVNDEKIGYDAIKRVGPGGNFVIDEHTLKNFRSELFFPIVSNRDVREKWLGNKAIDTGEYAWHMSDKILNDHRPENLEKSIIERIRVEFPEIISI